MTKIMYKFILILVLILVSNSCNKHNREVVATLTKIDGNDTILNVIQINSSTIVDLEFCVEKFNYPPKFPDDFLWKIPDTSGYTDIEKNNIFYKYNFDQSGKVVMYYYLGSYVSGIFPQPYFFRYCRNKPDLICEINDWFYRTKYRIKYDSLMNIQWIEKSDTINPRLEILNIKIK